MLNERRASGRTPISGAKRGLSILPTRVTGSASTKSTDFGTCRQLFILTKAISS